MNGRSRRLGRWTAVLAAGLALSALALGGLASAEAPVTPALNPPVQWSAFTNGPVSIVFPDAFPQVDLYQQANRSVTATLQVDGVYELLPGSLPRPTVVSEAFPTAGAGFNVSAPSSLAEGPVSFTAELGVRSAYASLWGSSGPGPAAGALVGATTLTLAYSQLASPGAGSGVRLGWTITGWPWAHAGDLLAIELHFTAPNAPGLAACTTDPLGTPDPGCAGQSLAARTIVWDASLSSLVGVTPTGPMASLAWGPTVSTTNMTAPYSVGALAVSNTSAEVVLGLPASSLVHGEAALALAPPVAPIASTLLHGSAVVYLATLAVAGAGGGALTLLYRRRSRAITAAL